MSRPFKKTARQGMPWRFFMLSGLWSAPETEKQEAMTPQRSKAKCPR
jgi:hypothetical protein